ncbi:DUF1735 domain-containing protein [Bacteroides ovatus]|uniref:DUF1735 domain-containing protein n=1 Tax=Bacteroides ovatus TaxID=28116 RepID=UPI0021657135|nr:DUF1735 domain-containing protein [Bacteroides ovatus]MCS3036362.1 DUF1735 domain-containing protein [Bacteroides ovatus]
MYVNYGDFADYTVTVYKSGIGEQTANVSIEVDEETLKVYNEEENTSFEIIPDVVILFPKQILTFRLPLVSYKSLITFDGDIMETISAKEVKKSMYCLTEVASLMEMWM